MSTEKKSRWISNHLHISRICIFRLDPASLSYRFGAQVPLLFYLVYQYSCEYYRRHDSSCFLWRLFYPFQNLHSQSIHLLIYDVVTKCMLVGSNLLFI